MKVAVDGLSGKLRHLSRSIPSLPLTRNGKEYLDWDKGMPLHRFLSLVCGSDGAGTSVDSFPGSSIIPSMETVISN